MSYKIVIENLEFETIIGILDFERVKPQKVIINLKIEYDRIGNDFIDYAALVDNIKDIMQQEKFFLIEDALDFLEKEIVNKYRGIREIYLSIKKPEILKEALVGVEILRKY